MDIASMLNEPSSLSARGRISEPPTLSFANRGSFVTPSVTLPTPSPEYIPSPSVRKHEMSDSHRPWNAAAFSPPLTTRANPSSFSVLPVREPRESLDRVSFHRSWSSTDSHPERGSLEPRFVYGASGFLPPSPHSQSDVPTPSMVETQRDIRRDRSFDGEPQARRELARFNFWPENSCPVSTRTPRSTRHRLSESRSSLSSYGSSTFSGGHSRISSVSTVYGPRLTSPMPADVGMSEVNMEAAPGPSSVRRSANTQRTMPEHNITMGSPESIAEDRGNKRKRSSLPGDDDSSQTPSPSLRATNPPSLLELRSRILEHARQIGLELGKRLRGKEICLFLEECDRDSPWRKVISHIFGRNKVCTRRVPERVWVSICRKHYQRTRYRKGPDYAKIQIQLVLDQIIRMIFWSIGCEENSQVNIEGVTIQSWTFSIRKRELNRLLDTKESQVPRWILENLGSGKTHEEIIEIAQRLRTDIEEEVLPDLPPIEFLPEVVESSQVTRQSHPSNKTENMSTPFDMTNYRSSRSTTSSAGNSDDSNETIKPLRGQTTARPGKLEPFSSRPPSRLSSNAGPGGSVFSSFYTSTRENMSHQAQRLDESGPVGQQITHPYTTNKPVTKRCPQPIVPIDQFSNIRINRGPRPTSEAWSHIENDPLSPPPIPPCCILPAKNYHSSENSPTSNALPSRGQSAPPPSIPREVSDEMIKNIQILVAGGPNMTCRDARLPAQDTQCLQMQGPWPALPPGALPVLAVYPVDNLGRPAFGLAGYWARTEHREHKFFPIDPRYHGRILLAPVPGSHIQGHKHGQSQRNYRA